MDVPIQQVRYCDRIWPYFLFLSLTYLKPHNFADLTNSSNCIRSTLLQICVMLNHLQSRHLTVFYDKTYFLDNCNGNGSFNPTFINMHFQNSFYLSKQTIAIVNNICHHIILCLTKYRLAGTKNLDGVKNWLQPFQKQP